MILLTLLELAQAASYCPTWDARFEATALAHTPSRALRYRWAPVADCATFTLDHYLVCRNAGEAGSTVPAPFSPTSAGATCTVHRDRRQDLYAVDEVDLPLHSFAAKVFACTDDACSGWYGDGTHGGPVSDDENAASTEAERWVLTSVAGLSDPDRFIADTYANAIDGFFYGDAWSQAGSFGAWYSTSDGGLENIRHAVATTSGWTLGNDNGASLGSATKVAMSAVKPEGAFGHVTHPWVMPVDDGTSAWVRMFVQADDDGDASTGDAYRVWSVDSVDDAGDDFGLSCALGSCAPDGVGWCGPGDPCDWDDDSADGGAATEAVANDGDAASYGLTSASHGRVLWPTLDEEAVNPDHQHPEMLITGQAEGCTTGPDGVYGSRWNGSDWSVHTDTDDCPVAAGLDAHDPGVIPLLSGGYKVYVQVGTTEYEVCRYDTGELVDCTPIELAWDDGSTMGAADAAIAGCTDNFTGVALREGRDMHEGGFLHAMDDSACFGSGHGGILWIEHRN